jgi:hypothetical protein
VVAQAAHAHALLALLSLLSLLAVQQGTQGAQQKVVFVFKSWRTELLRMRPPSALLRSAAGMQLNQVKHA